MKNGKKGASHGESLRTRALTDLAFKGHDIDSSLKFYMSLGYSREDALALIRQSDTYKSKK